MVKKYSGRLYESGDIRICIAFNCTLLVSRNAQEKFESNIKSENNRLTIEIKFNIITDKNVVTKCKCRAYCGYQNNNSVITWKSEKPMTFFYGHELKRNDEILALQENCLYREAIK